MKKYPIIIDSEFRMQGAEAVGMHVPIRLDKCVRLAPSTVGTCGESKPGAL
jgi:hypothetical protein